MTGSFTIVDPDTVPPESFPESGLSHRKLTERLGCTELRLNMITLSPGEATAPHAHRSQEEVYIALDGGVLELNGEVHAVEPQSTVRIDPAVVRSVRNESSADQTWLLIGAPPVGSIDDFGEYIMPD